MDSISFQHPPFYIILCIALAVIYAGILYYRHSFIKDPTPNQQRLLKVLGVIRFIAVVIIAILLLSPFIKSKFTEAQKPIVLVLQDNSESVGNYLSGEDSAQFISTFSRLEESLDDNFIVKQYSFSEELHPDDSINFKGKLTNISDNLRDLVNLYANQNVGAIILATDGIYNKGANPLYNSASTKFPIYTIAIGDTNPKQDLRIEKAFYNRIVYLNDRFKIRVDVSADNMPSAKSSIKIFDLSNKGNAKNVASQEVTFTEETEYVSEEFILDANKTGVQHYQIVLNPVAGEYTQANNYKDIFIDVLDGRQKVLITAVAPHPDISAIKEAIESNKNYEVTFKLIDDVADVKVEEFNLAILHQIPSFTRSHDQFLSLLKEKKVPVFFILGEQSSLASVNKIQNAIEIEQQGNDFNQATPIFNQEFSLFTYSDELKRVLPEYPPLAVPYAQFSVAPTAKVFLFQKIGTVNTEYPLLVFDESLGNKTGVLLGTGLWRWRLYDYLQNRSHEVFNELISKSIQYLAVKEDKRQFRVRLPKNVFYENESINFQAELYNDSYEMINFPDATITLIDEEGKEYPYVFNKTSDAYDLDAGNFPVGNYSFKASVKYAGKELNYNGQFTIIPMQLEAFSTVANHNLLYQLSKKSGGEMYYPAQIEALTSDLKSNNELKPVVFSTYKTESLINLKWICLLILGLLSLEWFTRKYEGGY